MIAMLGYIQLFKHSVQQNIRQLSTIFALSSGYGKCGVAVIRVSGPHSGEALKKLTNLKQLPQPRMALLKKIYHPTKGSLLDKGLVLWFPGPHSFTGEDCCEFQVHGGAAVISAVLNALRVLPNVRPAQPGEFTRRAFDAGKLDLTEVEGLSDLLQAETELQREQALLQTEGALSNLYNSWRKVLIKSVANIEAHIDFEESEMLDSNLFEDTSLRIKKLVEEIQNHLQNGRKGEILRNGIKTVIIGEPNVGKSSLLNILCQRQAAIVTPIAGTTRDVLQVTMDINGYPVVLLDTAGLRKDTSDVVEKEGIRRALDSIRSADFVLLVVDILKFIQWKELNNNCNFSIFIQQYINNMGCADFFKEQTNLVVINKSDLITIDNKSIINSIIKQNKNTVLISCTSEDGVQNFIEKMTEHFKDLCGTPSKEHPCMNKERHRHLLNACSQHLEHFLQEVEGDTEDVVIMAQYLRSALRQLGKLTGNVTTEDLLDVIFKDFCIGK